MIIYRDNKQKKLQRDLFRNWNNMKKIKSTLKFRARNAIIETIKILKQQSCTDNEIIKFLGKYAKKYEVTLTIPMIRHFENLIVKNQERNWEDFNINDQWDSEESFLFDDAKSLKKFGFTPNEIIKIFNKLLVEEYFSHIQKEDLESFINHL